jgi:uncharacterized OB-fold protein
MSRDAGFDDFLDAVAAGEAYYLETESGDDHLPPMPYDPATGSAGVRERRLPDTGEILTHTTTHVAAPQFLEDAPYVTAIADFGPVNVTGQVRNLNPAAVEIGQAVTLGVERSETAGERVLVFYPVET